MLFKTKNQHHPLINKLLSWSKQIKSHPFHYCEARKNQEWHCTDKERQQAASHNKPNRNTIGHSGRFFRIKDCKDKENLYFCPTKQARNHRQTFQMYLDCQHHRRQARCWYHSERTQRQMDEGQWRRSHSGKELSQLPAIHRWLFRHRHRVQQKTQCLLHFSRRTRWNARQQLEDVAPP